MEAWILHVRQEWIEQVDGPVREANNYSAWATEKQAWKAAADQLFSEGQHQWIPAFIGRHELMGAVRQLIRSGHYEEAVGLVNRYTVIEPPNHNNMSPHKVRIYIKESTFKGSAFE